MDSIVCLGGGGGMPPLLAALRRRLPAARFTAIVACTDTGRSTGTVRRALGIPAPGDIRHCLTTLAGDTSPWAAALEQRLQAPQHPDLHGVAVGNLLLGALAQQTESLGKAGLLLKDMLGVETPVLPVSIENIHLAAELEDGTEVHGEVAVRGLRKPPIRRVFIEGEADGVWAPARQALLDARCMILGPGSLWTSLGATLAVRGVREAIGASDATVVYVCNTTTQPGQSDGLDAVDHVRAIAGVLGRTPTVVVLNVGTLPEEVRAELSGDGLDLLQPGPPAIEVIKSLGARVIAEDVLDRQRERSTLWEKMDTAYHNVDRVAELLLPVIGAV